MVSSMAAAAALLRGRIGLASFCCDHPRFLFGVSFISASSGREDEILPSDIVFPL